MLHLTKLHYRLGHFCVKILLSVQIDQFLRCAYYGQFICSNIQAFCEAWSWREGVVMF